MKWQKLARWGKRAANPKWHLGLLCLLLGTWPLYQVGPLLQSLWGSAESHYGLVHHARKSPLLHRITFRLNGDDNAEFLLWGSPWKGQEILQWFGPQVPMQVQALRLSNSLWLVVDLQVDGNGADYQALRTFHYTAVGLGLGITAVAWTILLWLVFYSPKLGAVSEVVVRPRR